ncbi:MAG: Na(+)-translocating NADH-quinone reductase subunit C [Gammaproteobacteria bacterium]
MDNDSPVKALLVVFVVALLCSVLVSVSVVTLRPVQERNALIERSRNIIALSGLVEPGAQLAADDILQAIEQLDVRVVEISSGEFTLSPEASDYDARAARNDPELSTVIDPEADLARLVRRENFAVVYLVWESDELTRVILPVYGQGMWSTMYGYIALEADFNTIAAMSFYEQAETAGLGDQVQSPEWLAGWVGRKVYAGPEEVRFRVASSASANDYEVDGMSGATVTGDAVTRLIRYWFGLDGFGSFLRQLQAQPPQRMTAGEGQ